MKTPPSATKGNRDRELCTICMTRNVNCKTVECSHEFCFRCLSKWGRRKGNCPLCRGDVRRIHYKKRVMEPEFLKCFDRDYLEEQVMQRSILTSYPYGSMVQPVFLFNWNPYSTIAVNIVPIYDETVFLSNGWNSQ